MKHLISAAILVLVLTGDERSGPAQASTTDAEKAAKVGRVTPQGQKASSDIEDKSISIKPTDKQLALQAETDRLVAMATELKDQVDLTSRNILSIKVVRKAEEIEQFAKRLKEQHKR